MSASRIKIFPGNVLRVPCNILIFYEVSQYSPAFLRFSRSPFISLKKQDLPEDITVNTYTAENQTFQSVIVIDSLNIKEKNPYSLLMEIANSIKTSENFKIVFNITEFQDCETYKAFIDKLMNKRKIEVLMVGTQKNLKSMLGYLNQSGHMLSSGCVSSANAVKKFHEKIACRACKKIDLNCKINLITNNIYCLSCAAAENLFEVNMFVKKIIAKMRETCFCKQEFFVNEKGKHGQACINSLHQCNFCEFEGGQADFMNHLFEKHKKQLIGNMTAITNSSELIKGKFQCIDCGFFNERLDFCVKCRNKNS